MLAIGLPYVGAVWREAWPRVMTNFVEACAKTGARLVFFDNLYMYGPQRTPLTETTPLQPFGVKPATRVAITRLWQAASEAGRLKVVALRAPDFYGPGVPLTHLGDTSLGALARGRRALVIGSPDTPHDFAYVPDCARAVISLLDAPDDAYGQAWHVPSAPTRTPRQIIALAAAALGVAPRVIGLPPALLRPLGLFVPVFGELAEMRFQWDRPYRVELQPLRGALLVGRDAVRNRRAGDRAVVSRPQSLNDIALNDIAFNDIGAPDARVMMGRAGPRRSSQPRSAWPPPSPSALSSASPRFRPRPGTPAPIRPA